MATDLAEVLGSKDCSNLLFKIPIMAAILLTVLDVFLLLLLMKLGLKIGSNRYDSYLNHIRVSFAYLVFQPIQVFRDMVVIY